MRHSILGFTVVSVVALTLALAVAQDALQHGMDSDMPKSPAAQSAIAKFDRAKTEADSAHDSALAKATNEFVSSLNRAKTIAMQNNSLDEANRIEALIKAQKAEPTRKSIKDRVIKQRFFTYRLGINPPRLLELLPNGTIGQGAAGREHDWRATDQSIIISGTTDESQKQGPIKVVLGLDGAFRGTSPDGSWQIVILTPTKP